MNVKKILTILSFAAALFLFPLSACAAQQAAASFPVGASVSGPPSDVQLKFVSNNTDVALINSSGQIAVVGPGSATLKAFDAAGQLVMLLPISVPQPDGEILVMRKNVRGDYRPGSVYGPRLPAKELSQLRNRIAFLMHTTIPSSLDSLSDTDKIVIILSVLMKTCRYARTWKKNYANTAWGALVYGEGQCSAYARGFKAMADALGLNCYYVRGSEGPDTGRHQWVMVQCGGKWFHLEPQQMFNGFKIGVTKNGIVTTIDETRESVPITYLRCRFYPYENAEKLPKAHNENYVIGIDCSGRTFSVPMDEDLKRSLPVDPTMY